MLKTLVHGMKGKKVIQIENIWQFNEQVVNKVLSSDQKKLKVFRDI